MDIKFIDFLISKYLKRQQEKSKFLTDATFSEQIIIELTVAAETWTGL